MVYDVIIVGAGPAGLAAALDAEYLKLKTIVLEAGKAGGALVQSYPWKVVDSYLGFKDMKGDEVSSKLVKHVKAGKTEIHEMEEVEEIIRVKKSFRVKTVKSAYDAKSVILATGIRGIPMKLSVPGEELDGVFYTVSDPRKFSGKNVLVIGGGDSAVDSALGLIDAGAKVWLAHRKDELRATEDNQEKIAKSDIMMMWSHEIESFSGKEKLENVTLFSNKNDEKVTLNLDAAVICMGSVPANECLQKIGVKIEDVLVKVDDDCMTNVPGIFAAGDIVCKLKRIPQALATGERAAYAAYKYLKNPYWK